MNNPEEIDESAIEAEIREAAHDIELAQTEGEEPTDVRLEHVAEAGQLIDHLVKALDVGFPALENNFWRETKRLPHGVDDARDLARGLLCRVYAESGMPYEPDEQTIQAILHGHKDVIPHPRPSVPAAA